jgi:zinc transport system permease protein
VGSTIGVVAVCAIFSGLLVWLRQQRTLAADTLLGVLAHSALAAGIMAFSFFDGPPVRLYGYLFGDILVVSNNQLLWVYAGGIAVLTLLIANWQMLTLTAIHEDLAASEGINPLHANLLLMLLMTIVVAISIRIVGALLITSLLIIPAATARQFAKSPTSMAAIAAAVGVLAVIGGLTMSLHIDTPAGPSIVSAAALMFAVTFPLSQRSQ